MDWIIKTPVVPDEWSPCLQTLEGLKGAAHLLAFSSDGATLASVSGYMTIKFWDTITGQSLRTICGDEHRIGSVVFSPKGDTLASAAAYAGITCKLWDTATGRLLNTFHSTHVVSGHTSLAFCADGEKLALGSRELVEVWDIVTGQRVQQLQMPMSPPSTGGAFSADGTLYGVFTDSACIQLFDTGTGVCSKTLDPQNTHGTSLQASLAFSRSGTRLVSCDLNGLTLWNTTTGLCVWADRSAACDYGLVTISQDGGFVAFDIRTQESKGVEIRDGKTGSILQRLPAIAPMALAFSTDGTKLISSSADRTIKVWDLMRHQRQQLNNPVAFVSDVLPSTPMSPQNRTLGEESSTPPDVMSPSPCDAVKGKLADEFALLSCSIFPTWHKYTNVFTVDRTTATEDLGALDNENKGIIAVAFSSDAKQLASLSRHNFRLWDVTTGYCLKTLHVGSQASWSASLTFSRNNVHLAVVKEEGFIAILNAATGHILQRFKAHTTGITATAFSNDGATLASSSVDQTNKLWDPSTGDCKVTMVAPDVVRYIKFSESRSQLMTEYGNIDLGSLPNASTGLSTPLTAEMTTLDSQGYVLPVEYQGAWIQKDSKSILWVPSEYRTLKYDVRGSVIALGCYSGRLLMLELSSNLLRL